MIQWNNNIIAYFRKKKAISFETAISFDIEDFKKVSKHSYVVPPSEVIKQPYIKTDNKGNYYLDEKELSIYSSKWQKIGLIMFISSIVILAFFYVILANS